MIRLGIPLRQVLARLSLPIMIAVAFGVMLLGKADTLLVERLRIALSDALTPIYAAISQPLNAVEDTIEEIQSLATLRSDNARLREENERLRRWHAAALGLEAENTLLRRQLGFMPEGVPNFHAARVVAD
ncbi:MAG: rod shape-determining protein MreC, partial [Acetobacteraceae bacterium]|nr:rod shape-determining protein MreC [Acetobacteraceae bacterium]